MYLLEQLPNSWAPLLLNALLFYVIRQRREDSLERGKRARRHLFL
jgi:hypothetical protein